MLDQARRMTEPQGVRNPAVPASERLIVPLDVPTVGEARHIVEQLEGVASFFKIGLQLQLASGMDGFIESLTGTGKKVFIDYKYFDIGATVRNSYLSPRHYRRLSSRPLPPILC